MYGVHNFVLVQGETFTHNLTYKNKSGSVIDLSTYTAKMQVRDKTTNALILELSTTDASIVLSATAPNIVLLKDAHLTNNLRVGEHRHDLVLRSHEVIVAVKLAGKFTVEQKCTVL